MLRTLHASNVISQHHSELHLVWSLVDTEVKATLTAHWIDTPQIDESIEQEETKC